MASFKKFCAFVLVILYFLTVVSADEPSNDSNDCQNPSSGAGFCVPIKDCDFIVDILKKEQITQEVRTKLRSYQCGYQDKGPKVCCPRKNTNVINKQGCGYIINNKFDGAVQTRINEYPWSALISYNTDNGKEFLCGGSVINENYVLTSAHCLKDLVQQHSLDGVRLGEHAISKDVDCDRNNASACASPVQDIKISEVILHPNYDSNTLDNNIGLLKLSKPADFTKEAVWPICLPLDLPNSELNRRELYVNGWGANHFAERSDELLVGLYNDVSIEDCQRNYKEIAPQIKIGSNQICVREKDALDYNCIGERGDAFYDRVNSGYQGVQFGIMSFASKLCENINQPKVLTKVAPYMNWILDNIKP